MKKLNLIITIFLLILTNLAYSKSMPRDITFYGLTHDIKLLKFVSVSVEMMQPNKRIIPIGSGCIINDTKQNYILTCFHVVASIGNNDSLIIGVNSEIGKIFYTSKVVKVDSINDLALIDIINPVINKPDKKYEKIAKEYNFNQIPIDTTIFANEIDLREGLGVLMIGYPLGLGAHAISNFPISRSGIIAQIIPNNPFFLIDGITSHGNSGSPVFTVYEGSYKFQGIIKGGPQDFIRAFDENRRLIASLPYNSGLSICISSSTIKKFIYK